MNLINLLVPISMYLFYTKYDYGIDYIINDKLKMGRNIYRYCFLILIISANIFYIFEIEYFLKYLYIAFFFLFILEKT